MEKIISLHNHTGEGGYEKGGSASKYTLPSYKELIDTLLKHNIHIAAITDHDYDGAIDDILDNDHFEYEILNLDNRGVKVIQEGKADLYLLRGVEKVRPCHDLIIGHNESLGITPYQEDDVDGLADIISEGINGGGFSGVVHPFNRPFGGATEDQLTKLIKKGVVDFIEGWNAQNTLIWSKYNEMSKKFARDHNIPAVATSDSHTLRDIPKGYITIDDKDLDFSSGNSLVSSLKRNIKANNFKNHEGNNRFQLLAIMYYQPFSYIVSEKGRRAIPEMLSRFSRK